MDNFPANSHKAKDDSEKREPKKVEKIVDGEVQRRKKPLGKRFKESMLGGDDFNTVASSVVMDILLPAMKDMATDAVSQGFEKMVYGEVKSVGRRTGQRPGSGNSGYISYNRFGGNSRAPESTRGVSRKARATHDFDEIILETRVEATDVIDRLFEIISKYESATVSDLYELVGITGDYTDDKYGWIDFQGAGVTRVRGGYLLDLPKPEPLNS